jgi:hypothetical protein
MPGVAIGNETDMGAGWSRLFQVLNDFPDDRFPQAAALVGWLDRDIHYLIEKASVRGQKDCDFRVFWRTNTRCSN